MTGKCRDETGHGIAKKGHGIANGGFRLTAKFLVGIVCVFLLAACGRSSPGSAPAASSHSAPRSTGAVATTPAVTTGCGTYCQQAGHSAGTTVPGYPCPAAGCLRCPPQHCVTLESAGATATNGVATVKLSCNLSTVCRGAFLLCLPGALCENPPDATADGGRLAGSDFVVPPRATRDVGVALTDLGKQGVSQQGGVSATPLVDLLDYGTVLDPGNGLIGNFNLTSTDPPSFPVGATASCGRFLFVGPDTSCPFAKDVEKAFNNTTNGYLRNATVTAFSPVTGQTYVMHCTGGSPIVCRGGTNALVEFYLF